MPLADFDTSRIEGTLDVLRKRPPFWEYATPFDRLLVLLGLNCGFNRGEVGTLLREEVYLHAPNPALPASDDRPPGGDTSWVMRCRRKTGVFGVWNLWPISVRGVEWWLARRPAAESRRLLLRSNGRPLTERTTGGHPTALVPNRWAALTDRVRKDHTAFPRLSFGKARKTSADLIRVDAGGEVAYMQLSHGVPFKGDSLVEAYTNKPFARLHQALDALGRRLAGVWASVADPFPEVVSKGGPNISRGTIRRIHELRVADETVGEIAAEVGVSRETVRRWLRREQRSQ